MSSHVETSQITLVLTDNPEMLKWLKRRNALSEDKNGKFFVRRFNGVEFKFYEGKPITVGQSVGRFLRKSSAILASDDDLGGEFKPVLKIVKQFEVGEGEDSLRDKVCPSCGKRFERARQLGSHMARDCEVISAEEAERKGKEEAARTPSAPIPQRKLKPVPSYLNEPETKPESESESEPDADADADQSDPTATDSPDESEPSSGNDQGTA